MFCPECGTRVEDDARFCPECGTKLEPIAVSEPQRPQEPERPREPERLREPENVEEVRRPREPEPVEEVRRPREPELPPVVARGFILTNIATLSRRLRVNPSMLRELIEAYMKGLRTGGFEYRLVDASDYTYKKKGLFSAPKHVSLNQDNAWYEYADLLKDMHDDEVKHREIESEYLFIIGGDEDVPMPLLPNLFPNEHDKDMDTDLLYAYPYGREMGQKLMSQELFQLDALFYVGRLPVAMDGKFEDIENYFRRAVASGLSVPVDMAYSQCDPHWRNVTCAITQCLDKEGFFPSYKQDVPEDILYQGKIFESPYVMIDPRNGEMIPRVFNTLANYLFFNMHGASERQSSGFYGVSLVKGEGSCEGINPSVIATLERPNILFTQACYGGRWIDYPKRYSMMLTAITNQTLIYVGSSRIAYGAQDRKDGIALSTSDVLAKAFNEKMLAGYPAGRAFFEARIATYKNQPGEPCHALTICEFNLYGDPVISVDRGNKAFSGSKGAILGPNDRVGVVKTEVLMKKSAEPQSLLDQVRQAVDRNILEISKVMAKNLYEQFNIPAREPSIVQKMTYADGHVDLSFTYPIHEDDKGVRSEAIVTTDEKGEMKRVLTTK